MTEQPEQARTLPTRIQYAHGSGRFHRGNHLLADYFDRETGDLIERAFEAQAAAPEQDEAVRLLEQVGNALVAVYTASDEDDVPLVDLMAPDLFVIVTEAVAAFSSRSLASPPPVPAALREVWTVNFSNYSPAEVVAVYATREAAEADADSRDGPYEVGRWEVEGPPPVPAALDVTLLRKALVNLHRILDGERPLADQIAAEYARLSHQSEDA